MFFEWALLVTGLFLIFLEFFLPSAIMAVGGTLLLLASLIFFHMDDPRPFALLIYACSLVCAVYAVARIARWKVRSSKKTAVPDADGFQALPYSKELVGKIGVAATDLKPSGQVWIEDQSFEAQSVSEEILKGSEIQVMSGQGTKLLVRLKAAVTPPL